MEWNCPVCEKKCLKRLQLVFHVNNKHILSGWRPPYDCGQGNCPNSYDSLEKWNSHLRKIHDRRPVLFSAHDHTGDNRQPEHSSHDCDPDLKAASETSADFEDLDETAASFEESQDLLKNAAIRFVSDIRATSSATVSLCEKAVEGCNNVVEQTVDHLRDFVLTSFAGKVPESVMDEVSQKFSLCSRPLEFLSTDSKQKNYFQSLSSFVKPVKLLYGPPRYEIASGTDGQPFQKVVYDSWQYIPIAETLKVILSQPEMFSQLMSKPTNNDGILAEFVDGQLFQQLSSGRQKAFAALDLYYDDLETANPLGSKATVHKLGVFYFVIQNLPSYHNASMSHIHLVAVAYTNDLKKYGYNRVLEKIASDLEMLERDGISIQIGENIQRLHALLATFNGDNLGRHTVFGLFESFRAIIFCEKCSARRPEIQELFHERHFILRDPESFNSQVEEVLADPSKSSDHGIRGFCALNRLDHWHVTQNWVGDLMHDFLEGVGPFETKLVLCSLIQEKHFKLEELNARIAGFPYGKTDVTNRPSLIPNMDPQSHSLKQKAFQFYCLFRLLPLIIGELVPPGNEFWDFFLELRKCADFLFSQKWTAGTAAQFAYLWEIHQIKFKRLFPDFQLLPKHHFLVHYPTLVRMTGPVYKNMVAAQEMKGNFLKRSAHVVCNFRNLPHTMAWRMQFFSNNCYLSGLFVKDKIDFRNRNLVNVSSVICFEQICAALNINADGDVISGNDVDFRGQSYSKGNVLVLEVDDLPIFGVLCFTVANLKNCDKGGRAFVVNVMETLRFSEHYWSYVTKLTSCFRVVLCDLLNDFRPLDMYDSIFPNEYFVSPRYLLF